MLRCVPLHLLFIIFITIHALPCSPPSLSPPDGSSFDPSLPRFVLLLVYPENISLANPNAPSQSSVPLSSFTSASLTDWFALHSPVYVWDQSGNVRAPLAAAVVLDGNGDSMGDRFRALFSPSGATELYAVLQRDSVIGSATNEAYPAASIARYVASASSASCTLGSMPCVNVIPPWPSLPPLSAAAEQSTLRPITSPSVSSLLCDPFQSCAWQIRVSFTFQGSGTLSPYEFSLLGLELLLPGDPLPYTIAANVSLFVSRSDALLSIPALPLGVSVYETRVEERGGIGAEPQPGDEAWLPLWQELAIWSPSSYSQLISQLSTTSGSYSLPATFSASSPPPVVHVFNSSRALLASYAYDRNASWSVLSASQLGNNCSACSLRSMRCPACDWSRHTLQQLGLPYSAFLLSGSPPRPSASDLFSAGVVLQVLDSDLGTQETITIALANFTASSSDQLVSVTASGLEDLAPWSPVVQLQPPDENLPWLSALPSQVGTACGQLGLTQSTFASQPAFCSASATSCLPPSLHSLPSALFSYLSDGFTALPPLSPRPRRRLSSQNDAIIYELAPQQWNLTVTYSAALRLRQPLLRISVFVQDSALQLQLTNEGLEPGVFYISLTSCENPLQLSRLSDFNAFPAVLPSSSVSYSFSVALLSGATPSGVSTAYCSFSVQLSSPRLWWTPQSQLWRAEVSLSPSGLSLPCAAIKAALDITSVPQLAGPLLRQPASVPIACSIQGDSYNCDVTLTNHGGAGAEVQLSAERCLPTVTVLGSTVRIAPNSSASAVLLFDRSSAVSIFNCTIVYSVATRTSCPPPDSPFVLLANYTELWSFNFNINFTASPTTAPPSASKSSWLAHLFGHHPTPLLGFLFFIAFIFPFLVITIIATVVIHQKCYRKASADSSLSISNVASS